MRVLWFTWKDGHHPQAGGAEAVNESLARRLAADGHEVTFIVAGFPGASPRAERNGFRVLRVGNRWTVYVKAWSLYCRELRGTADVIIDEINTMPFFASWYVREPTVAFVHQLARGVWFHEMPFPLSLFGWLAEPVYLRALSMHPVITVSESTRRDLARHGFSASRVTVMPQLPGLEPAARSDAWRKHSAPTLLAFGSARSMKRTLHAVRAFARVKSEMPHARLVIAGVLSSSYGRRVRDAVDRSPFADAITMTGRVDTENKAEVLGRAHLLLATSVKEGWCLVATEAAGQGTPAVGYDVDGLRDSIRQGKTGTLVRSGDTAALAAAALLLLKDRQTYENMREEGWRFAKTLSEDASYKVFLRVLTEATST